MSQYAGCIFFSVPGKEHLQSLCTSWLSARKIVGSVELHMESVTIAPKGYGLAGFDNVYFGG
jgi:hypothetical protein